MSVLIQDVALKTCRDPWTIETRDERGSGRSVLAARHDDDLLLTRKPARREPHKHDYKHRHYICHHHHHHVVLVARISLTLSRNFSPSFIASGRSSGLHPVSSHSCWMHVRAGRPAFALPYVGVHRSTSLMSSSLLLQQCPACLVRLTWIVFVRGGRWPYS